MRTNTPHTLSEGGLPKADRASVRAIRERLAMMAGGAELSDALEAGDAGDEGWRLALRPGLHEWFDTAGGPGIAGARGTAMPTGLSVLVGLAHHAMESRPGLVLWVGERCWPYPPALIRPGAQRAGTTDAAGSGRELLDRSVFIDPSSRDELVWAVDVAARAGEGVGSGRDGAHWGGGGVAAVIADGTGLTMPASRRLHLAASATASTGADGARPVGSERGVAVWLLRPRADRASLSAAGTRWSVGPFALGSCDPERNITGGAAAEPRLDHTASSERRLAMHTHSEHRQGWAVELLRCKGLRPTDRSARRWAVRRDHATGGFDNWTAERASGHTAGRTHAAAGPAGDVGLPAASAGGPRAAAG